MKYIVVKWYADNIEGVVGKLKEKGCGYGIDYTGCTLSDFNRINKLVSQSE